MACASAYTINTLEKSPPQRLSVVALFAITAVCILQLTLSLASGKDNEWPVKYVAGSKKSQAGAKLTLGILSQEVTGKKGKDIVLQIPWPASPRWDMTLPRTTVAGLG